MPSHPKTLLFIVSNDFGELAASVYATTGQPYNVVLALPPRLYPLHNRGLSGRCSPYSSVDDLLSLADLHHPHVVFLFSGYLFGINGLFGPADLRRLANGLCNRGCRIVTSDPFLGLACDPGPSLFAGPEEKGVWLAGHFKHVSDALGDMVHLYQAAVPPSDRHPVRSFFNRHVVLTPEQEAGQLKHLSRLKAIRPDLRRWLFVLAAEDYNMLSQRHGQDQFHQILLSRLAQAARAG